MDARTTIRTTTSALPEAFVRLRAFISGFEQQHGCTSEQMLDSVRSGETYDTPEITIWLTNYHVLEQLEEQYGSTTGIPMTATGTSTSDT